MQSIPAAEVASNVVGLERVSSTKSGQDQDWNTTQGIHLPQLGDSSQFHLKPGFFSELSQSTNSDDSPGGLGFYQDTFCSAIYHEPNYGSKSTETPTSDDSPGVEITFPDNIRESWRTGLLDCHQNKTNAAVTTICPCVTFGHIAEVLDEGETTCPVGSCIYVSMMPWLCSQWIIGSKYRAKLRGMFNLPETPFKDWASHLFCPCCSLCQEYRELQSRGLDPSLGLEEIRARQQAVKQRPQHPVQYPPQNQAMSK